MQIFFIIMMKNGLLQHRYKQKEVLMNQHLLGTGDVSRLLGIQRHKIDYAISNGSIPEPKQRVANKRAFTNEEVLTIAKYFGVTINIGDNTEKGER
jgi:hypothetical protein